jgi:hypothetical protein
MEGTMASQDGKWQAPWLLPVMMTEVGVVMLSSRTRNEQGKAIVSSDGRKQVVVQAQESALAGDGMP